MSFRKLALAAACVGAFVAVVLVRQGGSLEAAPREDLKPFAHWVFAPDAVAGGKVADRAGKLPGTIAGKPKVSAEGIAFAGPEDAVVVRNVVTPADPFLPAQAFTVAAWVRVDEPTDWGGILGCLQDNGDAEKGFLLGFNRTRFYFALATKGADDGNGKMTYLTGKADYQPGRWYHVAATYDGKTMRLFLNGEPDGESAEQSGPVLYAGSAPLVLGRYRDDNEDYPIQAAFREVLWCDRAVPAPQLAAHFEPDRKRAAEPPAGPGVKFLVEPYLQFATRTSIAILCETDVPTTCVVEYGSTFPPGQKVEIKAAGTMHEAKLENLQPKTKYFYRVVCTGPDGRVLTGRPLTFLTAGDPADAVSFTVVGDTQRNPAVTGKIAKLMWERRPNFVLHMGDVVDSGPTQSQWIDHLFRPSRELVARVPMYPCIGNHERNHANYYKYFSLPKPEYHYSFKYGNVEFFSLDTNKPIAAGSDQYAWLDNALAASDATWKVCYHHHPCFSSYEYDYRDVSKGIAKYGDPRAQALIPLYEKHKVDLVMNGHNHLYERTWPLRDGKVNRTDGVVYLTSGGGGGALDDFGVLPTFFKNQGRSDFHFCHFTVHGGTLEGKAFDHEGRLFDTFSLQKP